MMFSLPTHIHSTSEADTEALGERLGTELPPGTVIALEGDLGAGKTCLVRGVARALGIEQPITSPTFAIINRYRGETADLVHMDLYRISGADEALAMGFDEYLTPRSFTCIEWPERADELLPPGTLQIIITYGDTPSSRTISIAAEHQEKG
jgi:tRNA threonylcarbamoyladenosine biosynthesis protein TsaE